MTMPGQTRPDGTIVEGGNWRENENQASVVAAVGGPVKDAWQGAQDAWRAQWASNEGAFASVLDGQDGISNRLELLRDVSGYCSSFMGHNWSVATSTKVVVPFDRTVGPTKRASVIAPSGDKSGWLVLKAGGLWRVDAHITTSGYTQNVTIIPVSYPPYVIYVYTYDPIAPRFWIEAFNAAGDLLTVRQFDALGNYAVYSADVFGQVASPISTHFQHTFVVENMPPENDPTAPDRWVYVRLSMQYEPINTSGQFSTVAQCKLSGGTKFSSLTATRWSRDVQNNVYAPTVPDGGRLE
ncbi:Phage tail protein [Nocardia ninae]|uniref:Uncharacterized protein n=1 Tax=Nocardia ninae NBRC 108245 TaxID=1210091 RepID=A0A511MPB8_9NOCA|nr:hypothetical protein [Nocardia ninae]GEM41987.1 hypothetical protein NN4_65060 [Nocardia ninae NBRC 108245]